MIFKRGNVKLKIVSDGTVMGTKITDGDGNLVENIQAVEIRWKLDLGDLRAKEYLTARATIDCVLTPCDISVVGECIELPAGVLKSAEA